jgi:hypothetical protein
MNLVAIIDYFFEVRNCWTKFSYQRLVLSDYFTLYKHEKKELRIEG